MVDDADLTLLAFSCLSVNRRKDPFDIGINTRASLQFTDTHRTVQAHFPQIWSGATQVLNVTVRFIFVPTTFAGLRSGSRL